MIEKFYNSAHLSTAIFAALGVDNFHNYLFMLNFTPAEAAATLGVTARTVKVYALKNCAPPPAIISLYSLAGFVISDGFEGWQFRDKNLYAPDSDQGVNSSQVKNLAFLQDVYRRVMDENQALRTENDYLKRLFAAEQVKLHQSHAPFQFDQVDHEADDTYITTGCQRFTYKFKHA